MRIALTVKPGSSQEKVEETIVTENDRMVTVWTHAQAHDGEANKAVIRILSDYYNVPKTTVRIVRGENSKMKIVEI